MRGTKIAFLFAVSCLMSCGRHNSSDSILAEPKSREVRRTTIRLESSAFKEGETIPKVYTCDGTDTSPPLEWSGVPEAARSLSLIVEDPDAPVGTFTHWVLFNLPSDLKGLSEGIPPEGEVKLTPGGATARQGKNDFGKFGYGGPCPPSGTHRYLFLLYALDTRPDLKPGATRQQLLHDLKGHILAEGRLRGR
jgi:Raf kinase inhibitor-like YbhB/YbcL family protein